MKRFAALFSVFACLVLLFSPRSASADTLHYTFSFSGGGYSGAGNFVLTSTTTAGQYQITGISGSSTIPGAVSSAISSLLPAGAYPANNATNPNQANDNLAFPGTSFLDYQGVSYQLQSGAQFNLFYNGGPYGILANGLANSINLTTFTVTQQVAVTPEPSTFVLLGTGLMLIVFAVFSRRHARLAATLG